MRSCACCAVHPFHGEGHRKVWARLRVAGLRTSRRRVLRLMRENDLVKSEAGRDVAFAVPAAGFRKAFDGAPICPKVLESQRRKLQEELEKRSESKKRKM